MFPLPSTSHLPPILQYTEPLDAEVYRVVELYFYEETIGRKVESVITQLGGIDLHQCDTLALIYGELFFDFLFAEQDNIRLNFSLFECERLLPAIISAKSELNVLYGTEISHLIDWFTQCCILAEEIIEVILDKRRAARRSVD